MRYPEYINISKIKYDQKEVYLGMENYINIKFNDINLKKIPFSKSNKEILCNLNKLIAKYT